MSKTNIEFTTITEVDVPFEIYLEEDCEVIEIRVYNDNKDIDNSIATIEDGTVFIHLDAIKELGLDYNY